MRASVIGVVEDFGLIQQSSQIGCDGARAPIGYSRRYQHVDVGDIGRVLSKREDPTRHLGDCPESDFVAAIADADRQNTAPLGFIEQSELSDPSTIA